MNEKLYWHFLPENERLAFGDNRLVTVGETISVNCEPLLCERGLHACERAIDAISYSPGAVVCRVTLGGTVIHGQDKSVGTERTALWMADATDTLHRFACAVAEDALRAANVSDDRPYYAIRVKLLWLDGWASDDELAAARSASRLAARGAGAVADSIQSASWAADVCGSFCVHCAANAAAMAATRVPARDATEHAIASEWWNDYIAARSAQNERLESMLLALAPAGYEEATA